MLRGGGGVMRTMTVRYRTDAAWPGIVQIDCVGLATDATLPTYWAALNSPLGTASVVSVFDYTKSVIAYKNAPRLVPGAPQLKPGCFVCLPEQYGMLQERCAALNALGLRRQAFLRRELALEWAAEQVRLSLARSRQRMSAQCVP